MAPVQTAQGTVIANYLAHPDWTVGQHRDALRAAGFVDSMASHADIAQWLRQAEAELTTWEERLTLGVQEYVVTINVRVNLDQYRRAYPHLRTDREVRAAVIQDFHAFGTLGMSRDQLEDSMDAKVTEVKGLYGRCGLCNVEMDKPSYVKVGGDSVHSRCASQWLAAHQDS